MESQIENLLTKVSELNHTIITNKQELCRLRSDNLNLKSRIHNLEGKMALLDEAPGGNIKQCQNNNLSHRPCDLNDLPDFTLVNNYHNVKTQPQTPVGMLDEKSVNSLDQLDGPSEIDQPPDVSSIPVNADNLFSQIKNPLNYLPLCIDLNESESVQSDQDLINGRRVLKESGWLGTCNNRSKSNVTTVRSSVPKQKKLHHPRPFWQGTLSSPSQGTLAKHPVPYYSSQSPSKNETHANETDLGLKPTTTEWTRYLRFVRQTIGY